MEESKLGCDGPLCWILVNNRTNLCALPPNAPIASLGALLGVSPHNVPAAVVVAGAILQVVVFFLIDNRPKNTVADKEVMKNKTLPAYAKQKEKKSSRVYLDRSAKNDYCFS